MKELSADEIEEVLIRNGVGVLALVDGEQPYSIPMSFGYDGSEMLFPMQWGTRYDGKKNGVSSRTKRLVLPFTNEILTIHRSGGVS